VLNNSKPYCVILIAAFLLNGCTGKRKPEKTIIAEVGAKKLFLSDISSIVPDRMEKNDSILLAEDYTRKWLKQELLLQKAEENLTPLQKDVSKELNEYRNSLLTFKYKNELLSQRLDSLVSEQQIEEYYLANPENFSLTSEIVRAIFIKIPKNAPDIEKLKTYFTDTSADGIRKLRDKYQVYAKVLEINHDKWVDFESVIRNFPDQVAWKINDNPEEFLKNNDVLEYSDINFYYFIYIKNYKLKSELAPLDFVRERIENLILNRRKVLFLKQLEENVYTEAVRKGKFKVYNIEGNDRK
jgi:hypothetical protein